MCAVPGSRTVQRVSRSRRSGTQCQCRDDCRLLGEIGRLIVGSEQGGQARTGYGKALIARLAEYLARRGAAGTGSAGLTLPCMPFT